MPIKMVEQTYTILIGFIPQNTQPGEGVNLSQLNAKMTVVYSSKQGEDDRRILGKLQKTIVKYNDTWFAPEGTEYAALPGVKVVQVENVVDMESFLYFMFGKLQSSPGFVALRIETLDRPGFKLSLAL